MTTGAMREKQLASNHPPYYNQPESGVLSR
jgi:hypothetical protein